MNKIESLLKSFGFSEIFGIGLFAISENSVCFDTNSGTAKLMTNVNCSHDDFIEFYDENDVYKLSEKLTELSKSNFLISDSKINLVQEALNTIRRENKAFYDSKVIQACDDAKNYCELWLNDSKQEHFGVLFLTSQHSLIKAEILFNGTIDSASVYPRVIAQKCLEYGAAAVILAHNHPSGVSTPSQADINITERIKKALGLLDIATLDHLVVGNEIVSLAESGFM